MFALKNASILGLVIFQVEKGVFVEILKTLGCGLSLQDSP